MENKALTTKEPKKTALQLVAERLNLDPEECKKVLKATAFKAEREVTDAEFMALMVISNTYKLNPILKEIYAFPSKSGGIVPIVSVDGWIKLVNNHPSNDGSELIENFTKDGKFESVTAKFYIKGKSHPIVVTEYLDECKRPTEPWNKWPRRMLRHKAFIQGARLAYGFSGIYDEDEAQRIIEATETNGKPQAIEMPRRKSEAVAEPVIQDTPNVTESETKPEEVAKTESQPLPEGFELRTAQNNGICRSKGCGHEIKVGTEYAFHPKKGGFHADCAS